MAKRKSVKKKVSKKVKIVKAKPKRKVTKKIRVRKEVQPTKKKFSLVFKNLVFFVIFFVLSLILFTASSKEIFENLFLLLAIIFGFIALSFFIVLLVLWFLKLMKK